MFDVEVSAAGHIGHSESYMMKTFCLEGAGAGVSCSGCRSGGSQSDGTG
jgi:hypothetical protein